MNVINRPATAFLLLLIALTATAAAQPKRQTPPKPQAKATPAPTPAPTFETLIPVDTYVIYGEIRGVGQVIRSSTANDLLEPILKLSAPPKEFTKFVKFLNAHADDVMSSRLLLAAWPNSTTKDLPVVMMAIEFASAEDATKFAGTLNEFLPTILPPHESPKEEGKPQKPPTPEFYLQRLGSLVIITEKPWTMKQLRPSRKPLLSEDPNFRAAYSRFSSEPVFAYLDVKAIEREDQERRKRFEAEEQERQKKAAQEEVKKEDEPAEAEETEEMTQEEKAALEAEELAEAQASPSPEPEKEPEQPDPFSMALSVLESSFFGGQSDWPEGVGFALSFEGDSYDLRALFVNEAGEKSDAVPFVPLLIAGPAFMPEAPNIFPADTELLATMSLDLPQIYATLSKPRPMPVQVPDSNTQVYVKDSEPQSPFAEIEKKLKINIKDDVLPLLGSEIAIKLPMKDLGVIGLPGPSNSAPPQKEEPAKPGGPALAISIKDVDAARRLMSKLVDNLGFKGASALAQTERREDTEIVSYANLFSYAFVGNFLVLSADAIITRHIVDSYLKHETLAGDGEFRNSTRWQPRPLNGLLYISPAMMESYKTWAQQPTTRVSDQTRAFLVRASSEPKSITYSLSNDGVGPLHEVHIPKNLVLLAVAGISGESNPPPSIQNERLAMSAVGMIGYAEDQFMKTKGKGNCGTLEELIAAELLAEEPMQKSNYRFELTISGNKFEVTAVPIEYGKSGHLSFFLDQTHILRGADHNGAAASASDPPIN